jgi:hypothetical protein
MGWLKKALKKGAKYTPGYQATKALGISTNNTAYQLLNPGGVAIANIAEGKPITARNILDPGGWFDGVKGPEGGAGGSGNPDDPNDLKNPWASFGYTPGIGYTAGADGVNPFANVMSQIPQEFFQNPQAIAALAQALGGGGAPAPAPATKPTVVDTQALMNNPFMNVLMGINPGVTFANTSPSTPGPAPSQATLQGKVGGLGNGGGKMTIPGKRFIGGVARAK